VETGKGVGGLQVWCYSSLIRWAVAILLCLAIDSYFLFSQERQYYFYHSIPYGSESTFNPISLFANGGFDEIQAYGHSNNLAAIPWKGGSTNVWCNITAPLPQINKYGWGKFLKQEMLPTSLDPEHMQSYPNYGLHLIGGGMAYRKLWEWYNYHSYPMPSVLGAITAMSYHYVNEIIENGGGYFYSNVDPIADLLIFDPLGIILFSFDSIAEFFATNLNLNDWSYQPALSFAPLGIRNTGQNFVMKYTITASGKTSLFYHFGAFSIFGLSFKTNLEESISFGVGVSSKKVYNANPNGVFTPAIIGKPIAGIYWDRNNSLLSSLVITDSFNENVRINIFPGVLFLGNFSPGIFCSFGGRGKFTTGITAAFLPLGISGYLPH
jgi:hypothetical protein